MPEDDTLSYATNLMTFPNLDRTDLSFDFRDAFDFEEFSFLYPRGSTSADSEIESMEQQASPGSEKESADDPTAVFGDLFQTPFEEEQAFWAEYFNLSPPLQSSSMLAQYQAQLDVLHYAENLLNVGADEKESVQLTSTADVKNEEDGKETEVQNIDDNAEYSNLATGSMASVGNKENREPTHLDQLRDIVLSAVVFEGPETPASQISNSSSANDILPDVSHPRLGPPPPGVVLPHMPRESSVSWRSKLPQVPSYHWSIPVMGSHLQGSDPFISTQSPASNMAGFSTAFDAHFTPCQSMALQPVHPVVPTTTARSLRNIKGNKRANPTLPTSSISSLPSTPSGAHFSQESLFSVAQHGTVALSGGLRACGDGTDEVPFTRPALHEKDEGNQINGESKGTKRKRPKILRLDNPKPPKQQHVERHCLFPGCSREQSQYSWVYERDRVRHMDTHTDFKRYSCIRCGEAFRRPDGPRPNHHVRECKHEGPSSHDFLEAPAIWEKGDAWPAFMNVPSRNDPLWENYLRLSGHQKDQDLTDVSSGNSEQRKGRGRKQVQQKKNSN